MSRRPILFLSQSPPNEIKNPAQIQAKGSLEESERRMMEVLQLLAVVEMNDLSVGKKLESQCYNPSQGDGSIHTIDYV